MLGSPRTANRSAALPIEIGEGSPVGRNHQSVRVGFVHDGVQHVLSDQLQGTVRAAAILHDLDKVHAIITGRQLADNLSCLVRGGRDSVIDLAA